MGVTISVADAGEDHEIEVRRDNPALGGIIIVWTSSRGVVRLPRLSTDDARDLASLLEMAADAQDKA